MKGFMLLATFLGSRSTSSVFPGIFLVLLQFVRGSDGCFAPNINWVQNVGEWPRTQKEPVEIPRWGPWFEWSDCSVSCGRGRKGRNRSCLSPGNLYCYGDGSETRICGESPCPEWSGWFPWLECSKTCGPGLTKRTRRCIARRGEECPGTDRDLKSCNLGECQSWSSWSAWSCSVTCGMGEKRRERTCNRGNCPEASSEVTLCTNADCTGAWGAWTQWSECQATCGNSLKTRSRTCHGRRCPGPDQESVTCSNSPCPIFTPWSPWGPCSSSCAPAVKRKIRYCVAEGGNCPSDQPTEASETCSSVSSCLGDWKGWTACSKTCGGGTRSRARSCLIRQCSESLSETQTCNQNPCPSRSSAQFFPWSEWTACYNGRKFRRRECQRAEGCVGPYVDFQACQGGDSRGSGPLDGPVEITGSNRAQYQSWSSWGPCSTSCGRGSQERERGCLSGSCTGPSYQTKTCYSGSCRRSWFAPNPLISRARWSQWSNWSECDGSCGVEGKRGRRRQCIGGSGNDCGGSQYIQIESCGVANCWF